LTAAKVGDVARLWKAYLDGVESYLTDPARQEELRREAERWIKALRLNTTADEAVARGLEMLRALRDAGLFDALRSMAKRLEEAGVESVEKMLKTLEGGEFWLETTPTGKVIKICGERCVSVDQRGVYTMALEVPLAEVQIPRLLPEEYAKRLHVGWLASDETRNTRGFAIMYTSQLWQLYAWLVTKSGRIRIHTQNLVLRKKGMSTRPFAFSRDLRLIAKGSTLSVTENGRVIYQIPLEGRDIKASMIKLVLKHLDAGDPLPLVAYYLGDGAVEKGNLVISVSRKRMHLFEGRDVSVDVKREAVVLRLAPELYARAVAELYLSGVGVLFDALHSHKWLAFKRLAAQNLAGFQLAGRYVKLSSANGLHGWVSFKTREEAERYAETAWRELKKLGIYAAPKVVRRGPSYDVVFDEKTLRRLAEVDAAVKLAIERLEILSTPRIAAKAVDAALPEERIKRPAKPKIETKREEVPRPVELKAAERREEIPKTTAPKAVDRVVFQLVDGLASMKLRLTYVMKEGRKMPTVNAVAQFSALEKAEEFRRRLRLSGINASVVSRGKDGYEVVVPKDELEKLTPKEKEAVKQYLEHVAQTGDEEKKKAAEEVLRRFDFGAKAINIGGIRLKLAHDRSRIKAEKYGDPQLIAQIKTTLENKLRETLGDEYEQWKDHIKIKEGGKRLIITQQLLKRLTQNPNNAKNEKT
jgi:hypothetical protein